MPDAPSASVRAPDPAPEIVVEHAPAPVGHEPVVIDDQPVIVEDRVRSRRWIWVLVGVLLVLRLCAAGYLLVSHTDRESNILGGDAGRYHEIAETDGTPYRDFDVEYPPAALALIELTNGSDRAATIVRLVASQLVLDSSRSRAWPWCAGGGTGPAGPAWPWPPMPRSGRSSSCRC